MSQTSSFIYVRILSSPPQLRENESARRKFVKHPGIVQINSCILVLLLVLLPDHDGIRFLTCFVVCRNGVHRVLHGMALRVNCVQNVSIV